MLLCLQCGSLDFLFFHQKRLAFSITRRCSPKLECQHWCCCSLSVSVLSKVSLSHCCFSKNIIIKGRPKLRYNLGTKYCIVCSKRHKQETYLCNCKNVSKITEINVMLTKIKHSLAISSPKMFSRGGEELGTPNRYGNFKLLKFKQ